MDITTLLGKSDPADKVEVPAYDSAVGRQIHHDVTSGRMDSTDLPSFRLRRRSTLRVSVVTALALAGIAALLLVTLLPGPVGRPSPAAAATLACLSSRAAEQPTTLGSGQYYYTEVEKPTIISASPTFYAYAVGTVQTWVAADGSGRQVTNTEMTPQFPTPSDRAAWVAAGEPPVATPPFNTVQQFAAGSASEVNGPVPLYNVSKLPSDPAALAEVLGNEKPGRVSLGTLPAGISSLDYVSNCSTKDCSLFERAVALLQGPDTGMTSALRGALFQVLATVPGVQLLGTTTGPAGQSGVGLRFVERMPAGTMHVSCNGLRTSPEPLPGGFSYTYPASETIFTIVVDPHTTSLLSSEESFSPSTRTIPLAPCRHLPGTTTPNSNVSRLVPVWSVLSSSGIVNSETATPTTGGS